MKFITTAEMRDLEQQVTKGEISYSRMMELINEKAEKFFNTPIPNTASFNDFIKQWSINKFGEPRKLVQMFDVQVIECVEAYAMQAQLHPQGYSRDQMFARLMDCALHFGRKHPLLDDGTSLDKINEWILKNIGEPAAHQYTGQVMKQISDEKWNELFCIINGSNHGKWFDEILKKIKRWYHQIPYDAVHDKKHLTDNVNISELMHWCMRNGFKDIVSEQNQRLFGKPNQNMNYTFEQIIDKYKKNDSK